MMCFRDRTFCASSDECANEDCLRRFSETDRRDYNEWAKTFRDPSHAGISYTPLRGTRQCNGFISASEGGGDDEDR